MFLPELLQLTFLEILLNLKCSRIKNPMEPVPPLAVYPSTIPKFSVTHPYVGYEPLICNTKKEDLRG